MNHPPAADNPIDYGALAAQIRSWALELGFQQAGIAGIAPGGEGERAPVNVTRSASRTRP